MSLRIQFSFLLALGMTVCLADMAMAQPGGRGRGGGRAGWGQLFNNPMMLIRNEKVREELELVDDQIEDLEQLQQDAMDEMRNMFRGMREMSQEEREDMMKDISSKMEDLSEQMNDILLPHQQTRLKQLHYQSQNRRRGGSGISDSLADELNISEGQMEEIQSVTRKGNEEIQKAVEKMRKDLQKKILKVLDSEQRQKWEELIGEEFDFGDPRAAFGRQRGGERGERGQRGRGGNERRGRGRGDDDF